jgi:mRNA interferase MazF
MKFKRGDFVLVNFPHSDLTTIKLRPVLIVQAENLNTGLAQIVVAMVSSNLARAGHACRVTVRLNNPIAVGTGLRSDSVIVTDNLATVELRLINRPLGTMRRMDEVDQALRTTLGL